MLERYDTVAKCFPENAKKITFLLWIDKNHYYSSF